MDVFGFSKNILSRFSIIFIKRVALPDNEVPQRNDPQIKLETDTDYSSRCQNTTNQT